MAEAAETLQPLLEQAVRESLRELARCAAEPEICGGSQSIECIVRNVSAKVLEEAGRAGAPADAAEATAAPKPPPPEPLLQDVHATPWVLWREGCPNRGRVQGQAKQQSFVAEKEQELQEVAPEDEYSRWAWEVSQPEEDVLDFRHHVVKNQALGDKVCLPDAIVRSVSMGDGGLRVPPPHPHQSSLVASIVSPSRYMPRPGPLTSGASLDDCPFVVRDGLTIPSNSAQHLMMQWRGRPQAVLIVAKPGDRLVAATVHDMAAWLSSQGLLVVLEPQFLADQPALRSTLKNARTFNRGDRLERSIDLVITVGGDGTLTWAVSLFRGAMPPVLSFAAGSLGFLTPFPLDGWVRTLTRLLDLHQPRRPLSLVCRMRLRVTVRRRSGTSDGHDGRTHCTDEGGEGGLQVKCLNEVLVHRGKSGALAKLDVGVDGERVTLVQGDGLILATPTGSTAYSLAAGGSMVHPSVPAILLTPVSPHSLSFRPALLPDSAVVTVAVPLTARCGAALIVDGKDVCTLRLGDSVEVAMSPHPVPTICCTSETTDWFASVNEALQWNGRAEQK